MAVASIETATSETLALLDADSTAPLLISGQRAAALSLANARDAADPEAEVAGAGAIVALQAEIAALRAEIRALSGGVAAAGEQHRPAPDGPSAPPPAHTEEAPTPVAAGALPNDGPAGHIHR